MTTTLQRRAYPAPVYLAAGLALLFVYLCLRNAGLHPTIFSDETAYSSFSRLIPFSEATVPSYLYFALFSTTNSCGDGFLDCARFLNTVLYLGAAPFIYLTARRVMRPALACACALVSVAGPANLYTLYFMPEASYFFCFWVLSWSVLRYHEAPGVLRALASGALLGILTLVKMHGLFVIPALVLFLAWSGFARRATVQNWLVQTLRDVLLVLAAAAAVRFGLGYLLAGANGLNLFGTLYRDQAGNSPMAGKSLVQLLVTTLGILRGHLMGLLVLFGVPLAALLATAGTRPLRDSLPAPTRALAVYMVLMVASLVAVTVLFTLSVSGTGFDTDQRLHMRYYDFTLPLLTLFAAALVETATAPGRRLAVALALVLGAALAYTAWRLKLDYTPLIADSPALHGLSLFPQFLPLFCGLAALNLLVWAYDQRRGTLAFVFFVLPVFAAGGATALSRETRWAIYTDAWVSGAKFARSYLTPAALDSVTVVGASVPGLYKAKFYLSSPGIRMHEVPDTEKFDLASFPTKDWLLVVGTFKAPPERVARSVEGNGFTLLKPKRPTPAGAQMVDFAQELSDEGVLRNSGLSGAEGFGRWSDAKTVELELAQALPKALGMELKLYAFGPNAGQQVTVTIGKQERTFTAPAELTTVKLDFDTDGTERVIRITVPQPMSPKQLGAGEDQRPLGLALSEMILRDKAHMAIAVE